MLADAARDLEDDGVVFLGHRLPRPRRGRGPAFVRALRHPLRRASTTPTARPCWPSTAPCRRRRSRASSSSTPRAASPPGCSARSTAPRCTASWRTSSAERSPGPSMADWFVEQVNSGTMLLAVPVAVVAGLVSFFSPCVVPAAARLRLLRDRALRADLETARRGRMLAGTLPVRRSASPSGSSCSAPPPARSASGCGSTSAQISVVLGVVTIVRRAGLHGRGAVAAARRPGAPAARRRARRRAAARPALRDRLDALPRARRSPPCRGWRSPRAPPAAGAVLSVAYSLGLGIPFILLGLAYRRTLGAVRWVRRHQVWVTRFGGADAGRRRAAAGHRLVGPLDRRAARLGRRLRGARSDECRPTTDAPADRAPGAAAAVRAAAVAGRAAALGAGASSPRCAPRCSCCCCSRWPRCPGSVIPQSNIAAAGVGRWKEDHPTLAPVYERLGLFSVYDSVWFSAIYLLLMVSLVGCIVPRLARLLAAPCGRRRRPAPRNLSRLPSYVAVRERRGARRACWSGPRTRAAAAALPGAWLGRRRGRPRSAATCARPATCSSTSR